MKKPPLHLSVPVVTTAVLTLAAGGAISATGIIASASAATATNVALNAVATASSQNTSTGQTAAKAIDGSTSGYPSDYTKEWATVGGKAGSWLKLTWSGPQTISQVVLYDRPNLSDQVTGGKLTFSDGTSLAVGALNNNGSATTVSFAARTVTSLVLTVTSVSSSTSNVGLAEAQAYGSAASTTSPSPSASATPTTTSTSTSNVAGSAAPTASSQNTSTGQTATKAIDGSTLGYPTDSTKEWATVGGKAGSWLKLTWSAPQTLSRVVLYDRPNLSDQVTGGNLTFSDGSTVPVGALNNDGSATTVSFAGRSVSSVVLNVTSVSSSTSNVGLAEIQAYAASTTTTLASPSPSPTATAAATASPTPTASATTSTTTSTTSTTSTTTSSTLPAGNWSLGFADEFNGSALDTTKWDTKYPWGDQSNGPNHEQQCYVPGALTEGNGQLTITATRQSTTCMVGGQQVTLPYSSGMIQSAKSYGFGYGYAETRVKLPGGQSMWPAFWQLPTNYSWPPEFDTFEGWGQTDSNGNLDRITQTYIWKNADGTVSNSVTAATGDFTSTWHTFGVDWEPTYVTYYVDGVAMATHTNNLSSLPMYLLANLAVLNNVGTASPSKATMSIDYIRVWKKA